jgi:hypothetical protein
MLALLAALLATNSVTLYSGPTPEQTDSYKDWIIGCDNLRDCKAVGLTAADGAGGSNYDFLQIVVEKPIAYDRDPIVTVSVPQRASEESDQRLYIDGTPTAVPRPAEDKIVVTGKRARMLLRKLSGGQVASMRGKDGEDIAVASLEGLAASLLRIDDRQERVDTPRALYRRGNKKHPVTSPGFSVSVPQAARSSRRPYQPSANEVRDWYAKDGCVSGDPIPDPVPIVARLDADTTLVILPWRCDNGVYHLKASLMIADEWAPWKPAEFDYRDDAGGDGPDNMMINPVWREGERVLESTTRLAAAADCGRTGRFIWDGHKFRLVEQLTMPECRGSMERIRVWKVDVVAR